MTNIDPHYYLFVTQKFFSVFKQLDSKKGGMFKVLTR